MIIVGLGNPGKEYKNTHHNVGWMFVDKVAESFNASFKLEKKFQALVAEFSYNQDKHYIIKPLTFMNLSGNAVKSFIDYYKISTNDIFVAYDDMDLPVGVRRIRKCGSAGGHNGMKSIINCLGTQEVKRLRIGIGRAKEADHDQVIDYVLANISSKDKKELEKTFDIAGNIVADLINNNIDFIMNKYN